MRKFVFLILLVGSCQQAMASGIYNPGSTGGGGSGSTVYPATATASFPFGMSVSTINMTGVGTITGLSNGTTTSMAVNYLQLSNVANANLLLNGNFAYWQRGTTFTSISNSSGTVQLFDNWSAAAPNVTITVAQNTSTVHQAHYSADITFGNVTVGPTTVIQQSVLNYYDVLGTTVTFSFWENSNNSGQAMNAIITDSVGTSTGTACTEDATWRLCSVTRFIASTATSLTVKIGFTFSGVSFTHSYLDGAMLVFGTEAIPYLPPAGTLDAAKDQFDGINLGIVGALSNSSAAAGTVGEVISCSVAFASAISLTSGAAKTICSVTLTTGDWDIYAQGAIKTTNVATAVSERFLGINTTDNALPGTANIVVPSATGQIESDDNAASTSPGNGNTVMVSPVSSFARIAASATYYLVELCAFTNTASGIGTLYARRRR